jgi:hypothetical protein
MSTGVGKCDRSRDIRPESGRRPELGSATRVGIYDRSHIFRSESGIRPESYLLIGVGHTTRVTPSDRSREIPTL